MALRVSVAQVSPAGGGALHGKSRHGVLLELAMRLIPAFLRAAVADDGNSDAYKSITRKNGIFILESYIQQFLFLCVFFFCCKHLW